MLGKIKAFISISMVFIACDAFGVEGGFNVSGKEWAHAVRIQSAAGSCSATIITQRYALTAAHCVERGEWSATVLRGDNSEEAVGTARVAFIDPRYDAETANYDVAVLSLALNQNGSSVLNTVKIQSSQTYLEMLNAKSPYRTVLVVGHGKDERNRLGARKAALVSNLTPNVGREEMLWASYRPLSGASRPGDSGGGIYMLRESQMDLAAVVSGANTLKYAIEGDTYESTIERYSPIAPSLCKASPDIISALSFDKSQCAAIEATRKELATEFSEVPLPLLLHMMRLLNRSPQLAIFGRDYLLQELAVRAFILGSRSPFVIKTIVEYMDDYVLSADEKLRQKENYELLTDHLIQSRGMEQRSFRRPLRQETRDFIENEKSGWFSAAREDWRNKARTTSCPHENCFWKNEILSALVISSSSGDWSRVFPNETKVEKISPPAGLDEVAQLVCKLVEYVTLHKDGFVKELLAGGVSQANISTFDSGSVRNISVKQGQVNFNAGYGDGGTELNVYNISISPSEKDSLVSRIARSGYIVERDQHGFFAYNGGSQYSSGHTVSLFENYLQIFHETKTVIAIPEFKVWECKGIY